MSFRKAIRELYTGTMKKKELTNDFSEFELSDIIKREVENNDFT